MIPEFQVVNLVKSIFKYYKSDYEEKTDKTESLLYLLFNTATVVDEKFNLYEQAVALVTRNKGNSRFIKINLGFNAKEAAVPTVHITIPREMPGNNSIGIEAGTFYTGVIEDEDSTRVYNERRFDSSFELVCTSDNYNEVLVLYNLLKFGIVTFFDTFSLEGIENVKISGQELRIKSDIVPESIYMRSVSLGCSYDIIIPQAFSTLKIAEICVEEGSKVIQH